MATDYKKIKEENSKNPPINYRSIFTPYSDKTHFVYELVQNADDNKSRCVGLQLCENGLLVWNDGCQFSEEDVLSICAIGFSNKDLTQIGTFGMGFKAVYAYTDNPEVYSGDERFRIPIKNPTIPEGIDIDDINARVIELLEKGRTVFWLPFREKMRPETEIKRLRDCLCDLEKRSLLFLRHLKTVRWHDESNGQKGIYSCQRSSYQEIQNASKVELKASVNGDDRPSEIFLVFRKEVQPPQEVIIELQQLSEDDDERHRIQRSADKLQPIEIAFYLKDGEIKEMESCVLFAYLPTEIKTDLRFIIQARYQTTLARENIKKIEDNRWNKWLVQETADFLPEILEQLKIGGLLKPTFFNVLPLKGDVENEFKPIAEALQKAMQERAFVPTEKEGHFAKAENVFYPNTPSLRKLVKSSGMYPDSSLLDPDIRRKNTKESGRCFEIMHEAGVKEINASDLLCWLEKQSLDWFKNRKNEWLRSLYIYFNRKWSKSEWERIKKLPLVRLENGEHVCVSDQLVFFPPDTDEDLEEIKPFLNDLPILQSVLLEGEDHDDVKAFLGEENLGIGELHPKNIINELICPLYNQSNKPSIMKNRWHVRYIFKSWQKVTESERNELGKSISKVPILRSYKDMQRKDSDFVTPDNAYLPQAYTGDSDLETYFSVYDGDIWFVDDKYLTKKSDPKIWLQFLKAIGVMHTPQIIDVEVSGSDEECKKRGVDYENSTKPFKDGKFKYVWYRGYRSFDGHIVDHKLVGLSEVLAQIGNHNEIDLPKALWGLLVKLVSSLPSEERQQSVFFRNLFQGTYHWFYRTNQQRSFDAAFYRQLKKTPWLPDKHCNLHTPDKCFMPTSKNQDILGDSVTYLHSDFDISTRPAKWLAKKLNVRLEGDANDVLNHLQTESQKEARIEIEKVEQIYKILWSEDEHLWRFGKESLIFTPEPEPRWWRTDKVFWEDESAFFEDDCGYLQAHYSEDLKSFFTTSLGVLERADTLEYVRGIQDITSKMQAGTKEIRDRVQKLYRRLWLSQQKNGDSLEREEWQEEWAQIRENACWLGKKGDEWGFFSPQELVWNDHQYLADIFEGKVPFWGFNDDLLEFAKQQLDIKGCSQAEIVPKASGFQERDHGWSEKVRNLYPYIHAFLKSPKLGDKKDVEPAKVLAQLSVCRIEKLEVTYKLKGIPRLDRKPPPSFLDENVQAAKLWLTSAVEKNEYAELISDALQEHFDVKDLGRFAEDLLTKDRDKVLSRWERKGLRTDLCVLPQEMVPDNEQSPEPIDEKLPQETSSEHDVSEIIEPKVETPIPHERPETNSRDESETRTTYTPRRGSTSQSGGHWRSTSNGGSRGGEYGGRGGGGEGETHKDLKDYLADNPSELGEGLKLVEKEYVFVGLDCKVDILLQDSFGKPVIVEVKSYIESNDDIWQVVRYKHCAAAKYDLPCEQVRSVLAAPIIPDDVKEKCKKLGIDPIEVSLPNDTGDLNE